MRRALLLTLEIVTAIICLLGLVVLGLMAGGGHP